MRPLSDKAQKYFDEPGIDPDTKQAVKDEEFEEKIAIDNAMKAVQLKEPTDEEGRLQQDIGNVGIGELEIPDGPNEDTERFKRFSADMLSMGILLSLKRYVRDRRSQERGLMALGRFDPKTKGFADVFEREQEVEFTNRISEFREGVTYLLSRNGTPEITVHGGDNADKLDEEYLGHLFESATHLEQVE